MTFFPYKNSKTFSNFYGRLHMKTLIKSATLHYILKLRLYVICNLHILLNSFSTKHARLIWKLRGASNIRKYRYILYAVDWGLMEREHQLHPQNFHSYNGLMVFWTLVGCFFENLCFIFFFFYLSMCVQCILLCIC